MNFWFLKDLTRLSKEKEEITNLQLQTDWLEGVEWVLESGIALIARIKAHGHIYEVKLNYPAYFPSTPPTITPLDKETDWSEHQYTSGTLCLEWGPDNWHSSVTGAQLLESAYKLIYSENPYGSKEQTASVPSRHFLTDGQKIRNKLIRFYADPGFLQYLSNLKQDEVNNISYTFLVENETVVLHVLEMRNSEGTIWTNHYFPNNLKPKELEVGVVLKTDLTPENIKDIKTMSDVEKLYVNQFVEELSSFKFVILLDSMENLHTFFSFSKDKNLSALPLISEQSRKKRLPNDLESLKSKKVGIVGLGSLGSKVTVSLGRMGVVNFYLVDDDIFMPGNIERHTLDWKSVGSHKVDAIKDQLLNLSSQMKVQVSRTNISGQEATSALDNVLSNLGTCDLIIDATATPKVFNYLSAVSTTDSVPMVWGEVFAGGVGGLIARSRPKIEPDPLTMRSLLHAYTQDYPEFKNSSNDEPYMAELDEEQLMIASDADVSVIASHLVMLAADTISGTSTSIFPYSMYLIGLSNSWIFEAPFDTRPISTGQLIQNKKLGPQLDEEKREAAEFLESLLEKKK